MMRKKFFYIIFLFIIIFQKLNLKCDFIQPGLNTITASGRYTLAADTAGYLVVDADKVMIDLRNYTLSDLSTDTVIEIRPGHKNIEIKNGKIKGAVDQNNDGILVGNNNQLITFENLKVSSCRYGLNFQGLSNLTINSCRARNCEFVACQKGAYLNYAKKIVFQNCETFNCVYSGFEQNNCQYNFFDKCSALETANNSSATGADALGFASSRGKGNLFNACVAEGTTKNSGTYTIASLRAIGFLLTGTEGAMENGSKIINSVANTTFVNTANCTAYGVLFDPVLKSETLTQDLLASYAIPGIAPVTSYSVNWSPCGKYLAIFSCDSFPDYPNYYITILKLTNTGFYSIVSNNSFYASVTPPTSDLFSVNWSPNGKYVAVGFYNDLSNYQLAIFRFDGTRFFLTVQRLDIGVTYVNSVNWSPDGNYLALATGNANGIKVYKFNGVSMTELTGCNYPHGGGTITVNWSPDGKYLAIGGYPGTNSKNIRVLQFSGSMLTECCNYGDANNYYSVNWSPDGKYLAIGGKSSNPMVKVFKFDGSSLTAIPGCDYNYGGSVYSVNWSPNGRYLAIGGDLSANQARILWFDGLTLSPIISYDHGTTVFSVNWSPDSINLAIGGGPGTGVYQVRAFEVMQAPYNCLLQNNKVCGSTSYLSAGGGFSRQAIGICGSGNNLYVKNVASYNDVNFNSALYNAYGSSLLSCDPKQFDNISQPPYEAAYGYRTCF